MKVVSTPNAVERWQMKRKIDVRANVRGRDLGSVVEDVEDEARQGAVPGRVTIRSCSASTPSARRREKQHALPHASSSVIGILLMLQAAFVDWRLAIVGFLALPAALVGGVLAAYLGDGVISLGSIVGFLTVLGIVARNGIMLIMPLPASRARGRGAVRPRARDPGRARAHLADPDDGAATGLALVPLLVAGTIPGHEIEHPMAVVILGGLITSTPLNLFVIPALYLRFGRSRIRPKLAEA